MRSEPADGLPAESSGRLREAVAFERALSDAIRHFLEDLLRLRAGESLLLYVDASSDPAVSSGMRARAEELGARVATLELPGALPLSDQAERLCAVIRSQRFDAVCELSTRYFYRTPVARLIGEVGARVYWLPGLDAAAFVRCLGGVDHERMAAFGFALRRVLRKARRLRIHTPAGTDLTLRIGRSWPARALAPRRRKRPRILAPSGILAGGTRGAFLGGQLSLLPIPDSASGTAVIDGYLWPPPEIGRLDEPIVVTIEAGRVVGIGGCEAGADSLARWLAGREVGVEHVCLGFHPGAQLTGGILEAERIFGCVSIGMGEGAFHFDGVMRRPSIEMDGEPLEERGAFSHPELTGLAAALRRSTRP